MKKALALGSFVLAMAVIFNVVALAVVLVVIVVVVMMAVVKWIWNRIMNSDTKEAEKKNK
jgi:ABC-type bacteriocin/lantibiotic exporter with double-glycine peptidase domain